MCVGRCSLEKGKKEKEEKGGGGSLSSSHNSFQRNVPFVLSFRRSLTMVKYARDPINGSKSCKARGRYEEKKKGRSSSCSLRSLIESSRRRGGDRRSQLDFFFELRLT